MPKPKHTVEPESEAPAVEAAAEELPAPPQAAQTAPNTGTVVVLVNRDHENPEPYTLPEGQPLAHRIRVGLRAYDQIGTDDNGRRIYAPMG
jgi:hypothetical protein